jgi:DNA-binding CsgD family transcriptional regulator/tetratricopeptide (TPR) repeat protein
MPIELFERHDSQAILEGALHSAQQGAGRNLLVSGSAGIGKTSLVSKFVAEMPPSCRVFQGGCELLSTPRPLGPVQDFAHAMGGSVEALILEGGKPGWIAQALLNELSLPKVTTVLLFEDVHWADHATMDLIKYIGRRIAHLKAVLILTYRDDELPDGHELPAVLGDLPAPCTTRVTLKPLTRQAVSALMQRAGKDLPNLYEITSGNPFFVSAILASKGNESVHSVASIRDMIFSRLRRLPVKSRAICEWVSVVPLHVELAVIFELDRLRRSSFPDEPDIELSLDACIAAGMLEMNGAFVRYRHELARQAIEGGLSVMKGRELHSNVFRSLGVIKQVSLARKVHHASKGGLLSETLLLGPMAAAEARRLGAHREALAYYESLLPHVDKAERRSQAEILEGWAFTRAAVGWPNEQVFESLAKAISIWRELHDIARAGNSLRLLAYGCWVVGKRSAAATYLDQAIELLESIPLSSALPIAYSLKVKAFLAVSDTEQAVSTGQRAIALSEQLGDQEALAHSLTYLGTSLLRAERADGVAILARGIALGKAHGFHESTVDAYHNLTETLIKQYRFDEANQSCNDAMSFNQQMDISQAYLVGLSGIISAFRGQYAEAVLKADQALKEVPASAMFVRYPALIGKGLAQSRLGLEAGQQTLQESLDGAISLDFTQDILPSAIALVECQVFSGQVGKARFSLARAWQLRGLEVNSWMIGALLCWGKRLGVTLEGGPVNTPAYRIAEPYRLELEGLHNEAAIYWEQIGAPFEQAVALMQCGPLGMVRAIEIFDTLGAIQAKSMALIEAKAKRVKGLKRGQYKAARENIVGLTARELEILELIQQGQSNALIAQALKRSERTIEHHISSMLSKTQSRNRLGLLEWAHKAQLKPSKL